MNVLKLCSYFALYIAITACSSTSKVSYIDNNGDYYHNSYSKTEFHTYHRNSDKKPALSDQALLISLLNRPVPEDQKMMLAFSRRANAYFPEEALLGVEIKGEKHSNKRNVSNYANIIAKDINSIIISR